MFAFWGYDEIIPPLRVTSQGDKKREKLNICDFSTFPQTEMTFLHGQFISLKDRIMRRILPLWYSTLIRKLSRVIDDLYRMIDSKKNVFSVFEDRWLPTMTMTPSASAKNCGIVNFTSLDSPFRMSQQTWPFVDRYQKNNFSSLGN